MKYEQIKDLSEEQFRRLTGIKIETFNRMIEILKDAN
ncbi:MAG: IS5/IS1182 family transposase, partial [Holosporales bacterium]|nr:IS5/IS1182 family transposase [Holosporales bacterium]